MATLIQIRRDTQENWTSNNPILASGEIAFSTDQYKIKIGDGTSNWSALSYMTDTATGHENATTSVHGISNTANLVYTDDSRLSDARTPTAHAATHASGGTDEITVSQSQVTNLATDLAAKAPLDSPSLTGTPTAPTATAGTNNTQISTTAYADNAAATAAANLVDSAPATLDTLNELAAALGDDPNFATTVSTELGNKQPLDADLTAIAGLTGTSGFLKKTAADTWSLDTDTYLTGNQTITLSGDVSGSGTTSIEVTIADDSHNHIISNIDGLQTALDAKAPLASPSFTGSVTLDSKVNVDTSTITVSTTSATTVNTLSSLTHRSAEYLVQVTQGSKQTVSKLVMIHDGTTASISEYAVIELGGTRIPLTLSATMSGTYVLLQATITDADTTNATVEIVRTAIVL